MERDVKELISQMTLEEKAGLCSGADFWNTKSIERLGIPKVMMSDGPHGLRKQAGETDHLGLNESVEAVCFPAACATASSFDVDLIGKMGEILGEECQAENLSILLGPAVNIKRSPLCGRNFEYLSEDPYLTGKMAAAYIRGVQKWNVGTSIKHFAVNNQEYRRMSSSSELSERALREIYLPGFEEAVKTKDVKQIAQADVALHDIIVEATGNQRLIQLVNNLSEQMYRYRFEYIKDSSQHERLVEEHKVIYESIVKKDKETASHMAKVHIDNQKKAIIRQIRLEREKNK